MNLQALFAIVIALILVDSSYACRMAGPYFFLPSPDEYTFLGIVRGYGDAKLAAGVDTQRFMRNTASSVIIEVTERIHTPSPNEDTYNVIPMRYHPDCRFSGPDREEVEKQFPIGSKVRVIARKATYFKDANNTISNRIRLESPPATRSGVWLNFDSNGKELTSADSLFDYSQTSNLTDGQYGVSVLSLFEVRKDLWRLEKSRNQNQRNAILDRMILYPREDPFLINFKQLLSKYTSTESEYERYLRLRVEKLKSVNTQ